MLVLSCSVKFPKFVDEMCHVLPENPVFVNALQILIGPPLCGWYHQVQLIEAPFFLVPLVFSLLVNSKFRSVRNILCNMFVGSNPLSLMIQSSNPNLILTQISSWLNNVEPAWISGDFPLNALVHSPLANRSPCFLAQLPTKVYPNPPSSQEKTQKPSPWIMIEILRFQVENKKQPTNRKSAIFYDVHGQSLNFPGKTRKNAACLASLRGFPSNPAAPQGAEHQTDGNLWELERAWSNT